MSFQLTKPLVLLLTLLGLAGCLLDPEVSGYELVAGDSIDVADDVSATISGVTVADEVISAAALPDEPVAIADDLQDEVVMVPEEPLEGVEIVDEGDLSDEVEVVDEEPREGVVIAEDLEPVAIADLIAEVVVAADDDEEGLEHIGEVLSTLSVVDVSNE